MTQSFDHHDRPSVFERFRSKKLLTGLLLVAAAGFSLRVSLADGARAVPAAAVDETIKPDVTSETAVLAGGCFWGVQGVFQHVVGVTNAVSGYAGGEKATAQYETVSTGETGHAESVQITYDPRKISFGRILQIYFSAAHDPTELNRQDPDSGTQYRSAIFPMDPDQAQVAQAYIDQLNEAHVFPSAIVTKIEPGKTFYPAESYHQNFLTLHPDQPYIALYDVPKIRDLEKMFPDLYRSEPVLTPTVTATN